MGMNIERAHEILSNGLANAPSEHEWCVAFKMALDNMCKYQKIEQILQEPCIIPEGCYRMLNKIKRVIKDEDVD